MLGVMYWMDVTFSEFKQPTSLNPAVPAKHGQRSSVNTACCLSAAANAP